MAEYEAGTAFVGLVASGRGFSKSAEKELKKAGDLSKSVDLDADKTKLEAAVKEAREQLKALDRERANPSIDFDVAVAEARIAEVQDRLEKLGKQEATPKVALQTANAKRELNTLQRQLEEVTARRASIDVDADITAAQTRLRELETQLAEVGRLQAQPQVTADTSQARSRLDELDGLLRSLDMRNATPEVQLQAAQAQQEALRIRAELDRLGAMRPTAQVDADIASATAKLAVVNQQLRGLGNKTVHVDASGNAGLMLGGVLAILGSIVAVAPAAAAALAGVAGAAGAIGQGVAAGLAGFSGIGDALKGLEADEKSAATSSAASSNTRAAAAKQVEAAQRSLMGAQVAASRAAITGAQQVADAERSLAQASVAASRSRIQADQQVAAARRAVSDAVTSSNQRVVSAERSLENAQRSRQYAQEALTDAVKDATRANRDLQLSVAGAGLSEERAALSLEQARKRLAESTSGDPLERADLSLSVREAEQNLKEVQTRYGDLRQDQAEWARSGVAGSKQVVGATRAVQDAQRGVQDASRGVAEAQVSGARQVADAQQSLAQAQQQAAWSVEDAQRGVADAQLGVGRAAQQAAWAQQDAARQVTDAQRQLADAYTQGGEAAAAGSNQAAYALGQLTPAGRSLVGFLKDEWQPAWKRTTDSVAEEMLPKVERALRNLLALEPIVKAGMTETGGVIGDLAVRGSELAASAPFQANFASIMASNNRQLRSYGDAGLNLFGVFTDLTAAAGPINEEFARMAASGTDAFESWVIGARQSGELDRWLRQAADTLQYLGQWLVDVGGNVAQFASGLAPLGYVLLETVRGITDFLAGASSFSPVLTSAAVGLGLATVAASKMGTAMKGLAIAQSAANVAAGTQATGLAAFRNVAMSAGSAIGTVLNPSLLAATGPMQRLQGGATGLAGKLGAGEASAGKFGGAVTRAASSLPLLGIAIAGVVAAGDAMNTSFEEGIDVFGKGGAAQAKLRTELQRNSQSFADSQDPIYNWLRANVAGIETADSFNAKLAEQRTEWSSLQNAQYDAGIAAGNYDQAVRDFGANSPQAISAQQMLSQTSADVAREQDNARRATMNATQALQDQQNKILAGIDARLALKQQTQQVADAQKAYDQAVRNSGPGSDEAAAAQTRLEQAQTSQAAAAMKAAEEEGKRKGIVDTSALSNDAYAKSVADMVAKTQGQLTPALTEMVQGLDHAGLAAAGAQIHIDNAGNAVATFPNGKTVTLTAQTSPEFFAQVQLAKTTVDSTRGTIGVDADTGPGVAQVGNFKLATDQTRGVVTVDGNISPADQQRLGIQAKTDGTTGTMWINGNPVPCDGKLNGMRATVDQTTGVMTIDGNPNPANADSADAQARARQGQTFEIHADTKPAEGAWERFNRWLSESSGFNWTQRMLGRPGYAGGGLVEGYATGGAVPGLTHKQVIRGFAAGASGSNKIASSDTVPAMLTPGEFVIRKRAVDAIGLPTLNAINGMALGGLVGFAAGGQTKPTQSSDGAASPVAVPTGDAGSAAGAATATSALAGTMAQASTAAGTLAPQLAAVTAQQQAMLASVGVLSPAMGQYATDLGVTAPMANAALQVAQAQTQLSTAQTAATTAASSSGMAAAVTGMSAVAQAQHAGLRAGQVATQVSTNQTAANAVGNNAAMTATTTGMSLASQAQHAGLRGGQIATQASTVQTAAVTAAQNAGMQATTGAMSAVNQGHLAGLRGAQGVTTGSTIGFANAWREQLARTMPDSANPLRYAINVPIRGITDAWNNLDTQFALGKHVQPYVAGFATGGHVDGPGNGTADRVPAMLSNGEFVVREAVASRIGPFLAALNAGQGEALQAAGAGKRIDPLLRMAGGGSVADAINRARQFAQSQSGKPYQWGGVGNPSWDCSGFMGGITHALSGRNPWSGRIGTTSTMPWGGFIRGLSGAFTIGNLHGSHMAGTLAGVNVESGGSKGVHYGGPAIGSDNSFFPEKYTLPAIGGQFISGGAGGGGFDPTPAVDDAFRRVYEQIGAMPGMFGLSDQVARDIGVARFSADKVKEHALAKLMETFAFSGGGNAAMWRPQIMQALGYVGQPASLAGITEARMNKESSGNPRAINNWDSNARAGWPTKGLMQMRDDTFLSNWDPRTRRDIWDPLANITSSMHYAMRRYGSLAAAYNRPGGYDNGGLLQPGRTLVENNTRFPERVLNNVETRSYDTLTRLVGNNGVRVEMPDDSGRAPTIGELNAYVAPGTSAEGLARAITWEVRKNKRGGVYSGV